MLRRHTSYNNTSVQDRIYNDRNYVTTTAHVWNYEIQNKCRNMVNNEENYAMYNAMLVIISVTVSEQKWNYNNTLNG